MEDFITVTDGVIGESFSALGSNVLLVLVAFVGAGSSLLFAVMAWKLAIRHISNAA